MENYAIKEVGYFWWSSDPIPEGYSVPDSAIAGDLMITYDGQITLELHGYLESSEHPMSRILMGSGNSCDDIQGRLKNKSEHVLLENVYTQGGRASFGGISYESYGAESCLIGASPFPAATKGKVEFDGFSVPLVGYEEWLCLNSIKTVRTKRRLVASHSTQKNIKYSLDDGSTISIVFDLFGPAFGEQKNHSISIAEQVDLKYLSKTKKTTAELAKSFSSISDFFLVVTGSNYSMEWPSLMLGRTRNRMRTYKVYFARSRKSTAPPARHNSWLVFPVIRDTFGKLFQQWQNKREELGPGMSLYLGTRRGVELYVEHRFVNLIWGLESLHRTITKDMPPTKLELKAERIIEQIQAPKDRKWLRGKLEHSAEPSLRERLIECIKTLPLKISEESIEVFCKECADKRNDISHFGGQRSPGGYGPFLEKIHALNNALNSLYPAIILKQCGLEDAELFNIFNYGKMASRIRSSLEGGGLHMDRAKPLVKVGKLVE